MSNNHKVSFRGCAGLGVLIVAACSSGDVLSSADVYGPNDGNSGSGGGSSQGSTTDGDEPEQELEESFKAPVVSGEYLWTANPESDRIARIHAKTLEVELFESGHGPTFLAALPKGATRGGTLIINELSQDASVFLLDKAGQVALAERFDVQPGASAWAVSRRGKYAIAWSKFGESSLPGIDGHQDLTLFHFDGDSVDTTMLAVGYRPSEVHISQDESTAYVVCDPGISVIDLEEGKVIREIFLPDGSLVGARDIEFSPDGSLAMSRSQGSADLLLIDTHTARSKSITLPGVITDVDMSQNGSTALAVMRSLSEAESAYGSAGAAGEGGTNEPAAAQSVVAVLDVESFAETPRFDLVYTEQVVGSVVIAEDGSQAVLYTNANDNNYLTILDPDSLAQRVVNLKAPARAAFLAEDGSFAVTLMSTPTGSEKAGAFALVPLKEELPPRIEGTQNLPEHVSVSAKAERALITTVVEGTGRAEAFLAYFPALLLDRIALPSRPLAVGLVADMGQGFVAQEHTEGRVTFVDLESGQDKTVTGFELAAKVVD